MQNKDPEKLGQTVAPSRATLSFFDGTAESIEYTAIRKGEDVITFVLPNGSLREVPYRDIESAHIPA